MQGMGEVAGGRVVPGNFLILEFLERDAERKMSSVPLLCYNHSLCETLTAPLELSLDWKTHKG